jgi:hypothetical protein
MIQSQTPGSGRSVVVLDVWKKVINQRIWLSAMKKSYKPENMVECSANHYNADVSFFLISTVDENKIVFVRLLRESSSTR